MSASYNEHYSCTATCIWVSSNRRDPFWNKRLRQARAAARPAAAYLLRGKFGCLPPPLLHLTEKKLLARKETNLKCKRGEKKKKNKHCWNRGWQLGGNRVFSELSPAVVIIRIIIVMLILRLLMIIRVVVIAQLSLYLWKNA